MLDDLDRALIHALHIDGRAPFSQIAAALDVSPQTVARRYREATNLKVNIGCGSRGRPSWVNVDCQALDSVNCVCDCRKVLPFPDNSVRLIFTEHFFEHIDYTEEAADAVQAVLTGRFDLALLLNPTPIDQVIACSDAGERMPRKSTFFYPKLATGIVMYQLD